jgi:hypothetical protein
MLAKENNTKLKRAQQDVIKAEIALKNAEKALQAQLKLTRVSCVKNVHGLGCGKSIPINEIEFLQTHWYVRPSGCTEGDYWKEGEGQYICPHCKHLNRLYNRPEIMKLKHLFKSIKNIHDAD